MQQTNIRKHFVVSYNRILIMENVDTFHISELIIGNQAATFGVAGAVDDNGNSVQQRRNFIPESLWIWLISNSCLVMVSSS